jgi:hypothetical protein
MMTLLIRSLAVSAILGVVVTLRAQPAPLQPVVASRSLNHDGATRSYMAPPVPTSCTTSPTAPRRRR